MRGNTMLALQWTAIFMLALSCFCSVSAFVVPAAPPSSSRTACAAGSADCTASPPSSSTRMKHELGAGRTPLPVGRRLGSELTVLAASRGGKGDEDGGEMEEKGGIEPKYLAAIALVVFAALYDLFVTHEGRLWEL